MTLLLTKGDKCQGSLSKYKGSFVVDMRKNFDSSTNTSQYVRCGMISVLPNSSNWSLKDRIIEYYRKTRIVKPPSPISGGEMDEIKSKKNDQEFKFLTMSCYKKEHRIMRQGAHQNLDVFIDDYPNLSCLKLSTKLQVPDVVHPDLELSRARPIDKNRNDNIDDDHRTKACSMTEFHENKDYEDKGTMSQISLDSETYEEVIERIARNYRDTQLDNCLKKLDANQEQHLKDIEAQFTNRLKQQKRYFEDEITEANEALNTKLRLKLHQIL